MSFETTTRGVSIMSVTADVKVRDIPAAVVLSSDQSSDLEAPTCAAHWRAAVAVITWETFGDHEQREPVCPTCCWDVMAQALLSHPFTPPVLTPVDLDVYRDRAVSA
jgi:hypothetical protein